MQKVLGYMASRRCHTAARA